MLEDQKRQQAEKAERDAAKELVRLQQYNYYLLLAWRNTNYDDNEAVVLYKF